IRFVEEVFSWFSSKAASESIAGDLLEEGQYRGRFWFVWHSLSTALWLFWSAFKRAPFTIVTLAIFLHLLSLGLFRLSYPSAAYLLELTGMMEYLRLDATVMDGSIYLRPLAGWML